MLSISNICVMSFSTAGFVIGNKRHGVLPVNIEMQLFLNIICELSGLSDVIGVVP